MYFTRREVARRLGVSIATVTRMQGAALHPIHDGRGNVYYDEYEVHRVQRTYQKSPNTRYTPTATERTASAELSRDVSVCIERGYSLARTLAALPGYDCEEVSKRYDELSATPLERHERELARIREEGRAKELLLEKREWLKEEFRKAGKL